MPPSTPEQLARRWVPGAGPVELRLQTAGVTNTTYRVRRAGREYALRIASDAGAPATARDWELRVLAQAAAAGIAPRVVAGDPASGLMVAEWIQGRTWSAAETWCPDALDAMARLLRTLQALQPAAPLRADPSDWVTYYAHAATSSGMAPSAEREERLRRAQRCLEQLAALPAVQPVLCHGDLHRHNVLVGPSLVLLDWEYARASDPLWDVAGWAANHDVGAAEAAELLERYLGRAAEAAEEDRLQILMWLYDFVCLAWGELYLYRLTTIPVHAGVPASQAPSAEVAARGRQLAARLCRVPSSRAPQVPAH